MTVPLFGTPDISTLLKYCKYSQRPCTFKKIDDVNDVDVPNFQDEGNPNEPGNAEGVFENQNEEQNVGEQQNRNVELNIAEQQNLEALETVVALKPRVTSVQSALSDLLPTSATHGTFSCPSTKHGLILIGLELNTDARDSFEHC